MVMMQARERIEVREMSARKRDEVEGIVRLQIPCISATQQDPAHHRELLHATPIDQALCAFYHSERPYST